MKMGDLLLFGALGLGAYLLYRQMSTPGLGGSCVMAGTNGSQALTLGTMQGGQCVAVTIPTSGGVL